MLVRNIKIEETSIQMQSAAILNNYFTAIYYTKIGITSMKDGLL